MLDSKEAHGAFFAGVEALLLQWGFVAWTGGRTVIVRVANELIQAYTPLEPVDREIGLFPSPGDGD